MTLTPTRNSLNHAPGCTEHDEYEEPGRLGDLRRICRTCKNACNVERLHPLGIQPAPQQPTEATTGPWSLRCVTCDTEMRFASPRPRVPLCRSCAARRVADRQRRRAGATDRRGADARVF